MGGVREGEGMFRVKRGIKQHVCLLSKACDLETKAL